MSEKSTKVNESQIDFLKPCPFCGADAIAWDKLYPHVRCSNHECEVAIFRYTLEEAIEKWNRRVKE